MTRYDITPLPKPRMTQADSWKQRPCVQRYWAFKDEVQVRGVRVPFGGAHVTFVLPMPKSWSKGKKRIMDGKPHRAKPDIDNLLKGLLDAVYPDDDSAVWDIRATKRWGEQGMILLDL